MGALIASAKRNIESIAVDIAKEAKLADGLRFGLVAYRDHPCVLCGTASPH